MCKYIAWLLYHILFQQGKQLPYMAGVLFRGYIQTYDIEKEQPLKRLLSTRMITFAPLVQ